MKLSRRFFIKTAPSYGMLPFLASGLSACDNDNNTSLNAPASRSTTEPTDYQWLPRETIFQHGIASGDPQSDRIILWTRINPISTSLENDVQVEYQISKNKNFSTIKKSESMMTNGHRDFSVKFDVDNLEEYQTYYYRFIYRHQNTYSISEVGRTKTLPHTHIDQIKIAMTSCSHYGYGYFNVYDRIADMKDIDVVLHLGDYLYEYGNNDAYRNPFLWNRIVLPNHEMITLDDYRLRHATYKTDRDLQRLHRTHPMIAIWDDHEFTDNAWRNGAENHDSSEGDWQVRSSAAIQAYYEWMPIREPAGYDSHTTAREKTYRQFRFGNLINLCMIDTRYIGRDQQLSFDNPELYSDSRTLLGKEQEQWLEEQLIAAQNEGVRWKLIGQQVQMM